MKYISTAIIEGVETVVVALPLEQFPDLDPDNLPEQVFIVPDSVQMGWVKQPDGTFGPRQKTAAEILAEKKAARQKLVAAIKVTTSTGKEFDGDETSQARMAHALLVAQVAGITSTTWVLANNVPTEVTLVELQEALVLSMQAMGAVWADPYL